MKLILAFSPKGGRSLFTVADEDLDANLALHEGYQFRILNGSPLNDVGSLMDDRIPALLSAFDEKYPGLAYIAPEA